MRSRRTGLSVCFDLVLMALLWALAVVAIGMMFRAMKHLFCLGYGC